MEWVEIIEPRTKEHMYANLTTGECVWDPPEGVSIKRTESSQWWELFDSSTQRFYYYNVASQTTVWHRPQNCDIIPLAKLQTLKQNTETNDRKDGCTQTAHSKLKSKCNSDSSNRTDNNLRQYPSHIRVPSASSEDKIKGDLLGSPVGRHSYRHPSSEVGKNIDSYRYCKHSQDSVSRQKHKDVGKTHPHESGSLRMSSSHQKNQYLNENSYQKLQESSSSQNIPHSPFGSGERHSHHHYPSHSKLSYSMSNSSDLGGISPTHSIHTPTFKKKVASDNQPIGNKRESNSSIGKHYQSFDCPGASNASIVSLTRSGSFMSSPTTSHHALPLTHHSSSHRKSSIDGNGGGASDDSMHEKYFKSTPSNKKQSRDSSPISPQNQTISKSARPSVLSSLSALEPPPTAGTCYLSSSSHKSDHDVLNLDLTRKPEKYLDKMKIDKQRSPIPYTGHVTGLNYGLSEHQKISNVIRTSPSPGGSRNPIIGSSSSQFSNDYNPISSRNHAHLDQLLNRPNIERHNKDIKNMEKSSAGKNKKKRRSQHHTTSCSDVEYDNGNTSPLYSNWDQEMQEHLLPLQHYILEQAKLSGCHAFGDPLDSDSYHSDSQSEHSLSGHEPDNEDSDHSDHGGYLTHNYGLIDDYGDGISYYAYQFGAFDRSGREDISEHVEAVLESERENTRVYSPVRSHPYLEIQPSHSSNAGIDYQQQNQKQKQSQTLPSPNRQTASKAIAREQKSQSPLKDDFVTTINSKQNNFAARTPNQLPFTPPITLSTPIVVPQLACMKECDIEKFAQDNLNLHSKGIFRKKASVRDMLSFTPDAISRPMLALARDKSGKKLATELFKLVQIYMGDRKARAGMSLNSVAIDIIVTALGQQQLRDELYVQLCRQTTENPKRESLIRGWELMAICLSFVPPSTTFQPALLNYVNRHRDPMFATSFPEVGKWPIHVQISHYATVCCKRLDRIGTSGRKQAKKPSEDEVEQARNHILRDSMFGNTLNEVMQLQKDKYPNRKLPWIQVTLSQQVLLLNGKQTEGIFRVSADVDEVNCLKTLLDRWEVPEHKNTMDAHAPASLLKLWYRELYDPLIPDELYNECVQTDNPEESEKIINRLPELNKLVLTYLVNFLQQFAKPDIVACTKMDSSNLAMVFAPNCLKCLSDDPKIILENARKEMAFMRTLIQHMDTSSVANLV